MKNLKESTVFFASCPKGLEECLQKELLSLGIKQLTKKPGGIQFEAPIESFIKPMLMSRTASRVFMQLASGHFKTIKELEAFLNGIHWENYLHFKQTFRFRVIWDASLNTELKNSLYWAQKSKDALVDRLRARFNQRPNVDTKNPEIDFLIRIDRNRKIYLLVDLCGDPLNRRGYRDHSHRAPLKENLAAGIVMLTNWSGSTPLLDPMCGSGTILTEALLIKYNISPQIINLLGKKRSRTWAFERFYYLRPQKIIQETFDKLRSHYIESYEQIRLLLKKEKQPLFFANDLREFYTQVCEQQFALFGAKSLLQTDSQDALTIKKSQLLKDSDELLTIITNPPYGERLEEVEELKEFYFQFGEVLRKEFKNSEAYVLCGNQELRKKISLKTSAKIPIHNGPIECRIAGYKLY